MNVNQFNKAQKLLGILGKRPLLCECGRCECGQVFGCRHCLRLKPWCLNGDDLLGNYCQECIEVIKILDRN